MSQDTETVAEILAKPERADASPSKYRAKFEKAILGTREGIQFVTLVFRDPANDQESSRTWSTTKVEGLYEIAGDEMVTTASQTSVLSMLDYFRSKVGSEDIDRIREHLKVGVSQVRDDTEEALK